MRPDDLMLNAHLSTPDIALSGPTDWILRYIGTYLCLFYLLMYESNK